jgi:hypothetical protein
VYIYSRLLHSGGGCDILLEKSDKFIGGGEIPRLYARRMRDGGDNGTG